MQEEIDLAEWLNARDGLTRAVKEDMIDVVRGLLSTVDVNQVDSNSLTLLQIAVEHNRCEIAKLLLESGADINHENHNTILFKASSSIPMMDLLLNYNANLLDRTNEAGLNLLQQSAKDLNIETVKWLVNDKRMPVGGDQFLVHKVLEEAPKSNFDRKNKAICDILKFLNEKGAPFNELMEYDVYDYMPIHVAAMVHSPAVLKYFLDNGLHPDAIKTDGNRTLLHLAAKENNADVIDYLIDKGANTEMVDRHGLTPLDISLDYTGSFFEVGAKLVIAGASLPDTWLENRDYTETDIDFLFEKGVSLPQRIAVLGNMIWELWDDKPKAHFFYSQFILNIRHFEQEIEAKSLNKLERLTLCKEMNSLFLKIKTVAKSTKKDVEYLKAAVTEAIPRIQKEHEDDLDIVSSGRKLDRSITENIFSWLEND